MQKFEKRNKTTGNLINDKTTAIANLNKNIVRLAKTSREHFSDEKIKKPIRERDERIEKRIKLNNNFEKIKTSKDNYRKKTAKQKRRKFV